MTSLADQFFRAGITFVLGVLGSIRSLAQCNRGLAVGYRGVVYTPKVRITDSIDRITADGDRAPNDTHNPTLFAPALYVPIPYIYRIRRDRVTLEPLIEKLCMFVYMILAKKTGVCSVPKSDIPLKSLDQRYEYKSTRFWPYHPASPYTVGEFRVRDRTGENPVTTTDDLSPYIVDNVRTRLAVYD